MSEAMTIESNRLTAAPRTRRGKKRLVFQPPRNGPRPVRALWEAAGPEERTRAHTTCVSILALWLGRKTRAQVAQELSLPPLRVWQLSQAALSGMLAGLLKQPRERGGSPMESSEADDARALKERIRELEEENDSLRRLLEVIKSLPSVRGELEERARKEKAKPTASGKPKPNPKEIPRGRKKAVQRGDEAGSGSRPEGEGTPPAR